MSLENISRMREASSSEPVWRLLGIRLLDIDEGYSKVGLVLKPEFANFVGSNHGGIIVTLADSAFGYAVNTIHYPTVAAQFNTHFLSPAYAGDELIAVCRVIKAGKRVVMAEISVETAGGKLIARATGTGVPLVPD